MDSDKNSWTLIKDNWDDFGYQTQYVLVNNNNFIGNVKIIDNKVSPSYGEGTYTAKSIEKLAEKSLTFSELKNNLKNKDLYSLGSSIDYYKNLYNTLDEKDFYNFLGIFGDLMIKKFNYKELQDNIKAAINTSLLRKDIDYGYDLIQIRYFANSLGLNGKFMKLFTFNSYTEIFKKLTNNRSADILINLIKSNECYYTYEIVNNLCDYIQNIDKFNTLKQKDDEGNIERILSVASEKYIDQPELLSKINSLISKEDKEIIQYVSDIESQLRIKSDNLPKKLGHYTPLATLQYLIKPDREKEDVPSIRLTNVNQMNDPLEGKILSEYFNPEQDDNNGDKYIQSYYYVSCATASPDNLPMWKQYAEDASGISLVYDNDFLKKIISEEKVNLYQVCYLENGNPKLNKNDTQSDKQIEDKQKKIKKCLENLSTFKWTVLKKYLGRINCLFKKADYYYENEYRLIVNLEGKDQGLINTSEVNESKLVPTLFTYIMENNKKVKVKYDEVILGPKAPDIDFIAPYICYCDRGLNNIHRSTIKYR